MDSLLLITVIFFWLSTAIGLGNLYRYAGQKEVVKNHLTEITAPTYFRKKTKKSFLYRFITSLFKFADDFSKIGERINFYSESEEIKTLLTKSNHPFDLTVSRFQGLKIVCVFIGFFIGTFLLIIGFPFSNILFVILPFIGFFMPILLLKYQVKKRQDQLRRELPDFLDIVSISLQAGSNLDQAIKEVIIYFDGPLHEEFSKYLQEIEFGVPREKAYNGLLKRNDDEDFQMFIKSLIQATKLGVPMADTFKVQAENIRKISLEQVKEKAAKASPKVTLITSLMIAPLVMLLIIGLVILNMIFGESSIFRL